MGKTPKPLTIHCPEWLAETPEMLKLASQGHRITSGELDTAMTPIDLFIGDNCWFFTKDHYDAGLLKHAFERARGIKYPPKEDLDGELPSG